MNRRHFLRALGIGVTTAPAIALAASKIRTAPQLLTADWFQTTRHTSACSPEYRATVQRIMTNGPCSLTRATIRPLTPAMFEKLGEDEARSIFDKAVSHK
jgi:hypothetical protein